MERMDKKYLNRIDELINKKKQKEEPSNDTKLPANGQQVSRKATHFSQYPTITFYDPIRPELSRVICPDMNLYQAIEIKKFVLTDELIAKEALAKKKLLVKMKSHLEARKKASIPYPEISFIKDIALKKSNNQKGEQISIKLVAEILGTNPRQIRRKCNKGLIPHYKGKGVKRYFYLDEILPLACKSYRAKHPEFFKS